MTISNNLSSIQYQQQMLNKSASSIASTGNSNLKGNQSDLSKDITDQIIAQDATSVNVNAIKTQDEMLGSLLDIKA